LPDGPVARLGRNALRLRSDSDWAAFADDGTRVALTVDGYVRVYELPSGRDLTPGYLKDHRGAFLTFLPDGRHLIVHPTSKRCFVADPLSGEPVRTCDLDRQRPDSADITPDGRFALIRYIDNDDRVNASVFDLTERVPTRKDFRGQGHTDTWAISPDGRRLFHVGERTLEVIDVATGEPIGTVGSRNRGNSAISVSGDGTQFTLATNRGVMLFTVTADGLSDPVPLEVDETRVTLSANAKAVFTQYHGRYDLEGPAVPISPNHDRGNLRATRFARYGMLAIDFFTDRAPVVWDPSSGKTIHRFPEYAAVSQITFGQGSSAVVRYSDRAVREWEVPNGRNVAERTGRRTAKESDVGGMSRDGRMLLERNFKTSTFELTDATTGATMTEWTIKWSTMPEVRIDPTGRYAALSDRQTASLHDFATGRRLADIPASLTTDFSPDGRLLATATVSEVKVTELASGKERMVLKIPTTEFDSVDDPFRRSRGWDDTTPQPPLGRFQFSADGRTLALFTNMGRVTVWSMTDGSLLYREGTMGRGLRHIALRPDGRWIAYTLRTTRRLALRDITESRADRNLIFLPTCASNVTALSFSPDGKHLISGHEDGMCFVWDVNELIARELKAAPPPVPADLWEALAASNAKMAARAVDELTLHPSVTVRMLSERLRPDEKPDPKEVKRLIERLGDPDYEIRQRAEKQLQRWRELVVVELQNAVGERNELEVQERLQRLLNAIHAANIEPDRLRAIRAIEVLERIGTPEAKQVLTRMASGAGESMITKEAKWAVERLTVRGR
jgi:WD40 repeat protein